MSWCSFAHGPVAQLGEQAILNADPKQLKRASKSHKQDAAKLFKITKYGPVAQLGERSVRIREVDGSIPFRSTTKSREILNFTAFL